MKQARLDQLADGIFAIVMTLLVIEIHVPEIVGVLSNETVFASLGSLTPIFASYFLSFMLLFTYWRGHHFIASVLAQTIDTKLTTINAFFLLFVALVPFSTVLLATYGATQAAIAIYGLHIIVLGLLLYWMRQYVLASPTIENTAVDYLQLRHGTVRILFPVFTAGCAMLISFINTDLSLALFTLAIVFNLSGSSTRMIDFITGYKKS